MLTVDVGEYRKQLELWWPWQILAFLIRHWIAILVTVVALAIIKTTFNNLIFPTYYDNFKKAFGFEQTLAHNKKILEADYDDLWHESEFCLAFLALQDEHQKLVQFCKTDVNGQNPRRFHWANKYSKIHLK